MSAGSGSPSIGVGIIGAAGYGAGELLRLLTMHPCARVLSVVSHTSPGVLLPELHPHLQGFYSLACSERLDMDVFNRYRNNVIFSALPHTISGAVIAEHHDAWRQAGIRCIDLSGDLRIQDHNLHKAHYPTSPLLPELRRTAVYGFTEWADKNALEAATLIANPGCLATAAIISLMPLEVLKADSSITITLATGSSGSGKEPKGTTHHPTRHANYYAYKPLYHQHEGEIIETVQRATGQKLDLRLIPHSLPVSRGILCTTYLTLTRSYSPDEINAIVKGVYANRPFIRLRNTPSPELQNVIGSNFADVSVAVRDNTVAVIVTIDNLIKGMAGQAIQNMNVLFKLPEKTGLWFPALRPV